MFTQRVQIKHRLIGSVATPCSQTNWFQTCDARLATRGKAARALDVFEYLVATFPDDLHIHSLLGNLACIYHSAAFAAGNEDTRQEMLQNAEENFLKIKACSGVKVAASQFDYSFFMLHLHRYEEATVT